MRVPSFCANPSYRTESFSEHTYEQKHHPAPWWSDSGHLSRGVVASSAGSSDGFGEHSVTKAVIAFGDAGDGEASEGLPHGVRAGGA